MKKSSQIFISFGFLLFLFSETTISFSQNKELDAPLEPFFIKVEGQSTQGQRGLGAYNFQTVKTEAYTNCPQSPLIDKIDEALLKIEVAETNPDHSDKKDFSSRYKEAYASSSAIMGNTQTAQASAIISATSAANAAAAARVAHAKNVIRVYCYYKQGAFEETYKVANRKDPENPKYDFMGLLHSFQWARVYRYADEKGLLKDEKSLKSDLKYYALYSYLNSVFDFYYLSLPYPTKIEMFNEVQEYYNKTISNISQDRKTKYAKTNLAAVLDFMHQTFNKVELVKTKELLSQAISLAIEVGDTKLYDDAIYSLEIQKPDSKRKEFQTQEAFLLAGTYHEKTGNKAQALEIWLNYMDYYDFKAENKMTELFYKDTQQKIAQLKSELGDKVLPHVNHNWGISQEELDNKKKDEGKKKLKGDW